MKLVNIHILIISAAFFGFGIPIATAQAWSLQQCIDTALVQNKALQVADNQLSVSQLRQDEARAQRLPKVTAGADYKYFTHLPYQLLPLSVFNGPEGQFKEAQFGVPHNMGVNVQLAVPLYQPQIKNAMQTTALATEMSGLQRQKSQETVVFEVAALYYNAQILHHQRQFVDSNLNNTQRLLANLELLHTQGLAKGTDVQKVVLQAEQLQQKQLEIASQTEQVSNRMKWLMGLPLAYPLRVQTDIAQGDVPEYTPQPSVEVRMAQLQGRMLEHEKHTLRQSKLPTVALVANYGFTGFGYGDGPDPFLKFFPIGFVGVQASYTLWNGSTYLQLTRKEQEQRGQSLQLANLQEQNAVVIANASLQRNTAAARIQSADDQVGLAQTIYQQTVLQQEQGTANLTDVLLADNALRETQQNYLSAVVDYLKADLELKKATQSLIR